MAVSLTVIDVVMVSTSTVMVTVATQLKIICVLVARNDLLLIPGGLLTF